MSNIEGAQSLGDVQADFIAKLLWRKEGLPLSIGSRNGALPVKRFNVHRNNVFSSLITLLRGRFPVIERLVGKEFFGAAARHFVAEHPPSTPALFEFGSDFPAFLESFEPARSLPYLPDVARLEWLRQVAYHAPDAAPMAPAALSQIPPDLIDGLVLQLHPSVGLIVSNFPVFSIWNTNFNDEQVSVIDDNMPGEAVIIFRPALDVLTMRLGAGGDIFIREIAGGSCLADAAEHAEKSAPEFALSEALGALLAAGAFSGYRCQPPNNDE